MKTCDFGIPPLDAVREDYRTRLLCEGSPIRATEIGRTLLGRPLEMYSIGTGRRAFLYVGAHHGTEWLTACLLYRFLFEAAEAFVTDGVCCGLRASVLFSGCTLHVLPMLNADGCELVLTNEPKAPLVTRQVRMSGGAGFLRWQANARGVDLNHNYDHSHAAYKRIEAQLGIEAGSTLYSGEYPESEPECAALANFVRTVGPQAVLSLHMGEDAVYFSPREGGAARRTAERIARMSGCSVRQPEGTACYGGLCDYTGEVLSVPSFTLSVGHAENPPPADGMSTLYDRVLAVLYRLPTAL